MTLPVQARLWLPVGLYAFFIFSFSAQPASSLPHFFPGADKIIHFIEYLPFGGLMIRAVSKTARPPALRALLISLFVVFLYALSDEIHQLFVPGRSFDVLDLAADLSGALAGFSGYLWRK